MSLDREMDTDGNLEKSFFDFIFVYLLMKIHKTNLRTMLIFFFKKRLFFF